MESTIKLARANQGTLGGFCNLQMITKALYGRLPLRLPATLETIIDGSVKKFIDLTPVKEWIAQAASAIVRQGKPIPGCLVDRLMPLVPKEERGRVLTTGEHWLDMLINGLRAHQVEYLTRLEELAHQTMPPIDLFNAIDPAWKPFGKAFRRQYADVLRNDGNQQPTIPSHVRTRLASYRFLADVPSAARHTVLLAAAAYCYTLGKQDDNAHFSDNCVWQLGEKRPQGGREFGIAQAFIQALREIGVLGEPVWTNEGAVLTYQTGTRHHAGIPVTLNGTWFNWLRAALPQMPSQMGLVPQEIREQAKAVIAELANKQFIGMQLTTESQGERLIMRTEHGHLFGYVQKGHEERIRHGQKWRIEWAIATDGNVHAILKPSRDDTNRAANKLPLPPKIPRLPDKPRERYVQLRFDLKAA